MKILRYLKSFMLGLGYRTYLIISQYKLDKSFSYVWGMKHSGQYLRKKVKIPILSMPKEVYLDTSKNCKKN